MKRHIKPPRIADRFFYWYCQQASIEDLHGDAEELFYQELEKMSPLKAKLNYCRNIISLMFSYTVKRRKEHSSYHQLSSTTFNFYMLRNYFVIASRNLLKHRFFTMINVLGLAVGMSIGLLLIAMLSFLWTYDNFHEHKDNIYRVISTTDDKVNNREFASAPLALADRIRSEYPGVDAVVRISATINTEAVYNDKKLPLQGYFVDDNFLDVFSFPLLKGSKQALFEKPNTIAITQKASLRIFGDTDPIGRVLTVGDFGEFEITGLLKDPPKNSHMQFEVLASIRSLEKQTHYLNAKQMDQWKEFRNSYVYLLLPHAENSRMTEVYLNKVAGEVYKTEENFKANFELQALNSIAPGRDLYNDIGPDWSYASLSIFMILTLLILLPACFNYTNISISRALKRMKEIGLRKAMGSQQNQIFFQFITETVIIAFVALALAFYIFSVARNEFLSILVRGVETLSLDATPQMILYFILFALSVGIIAGIVPALYFSKLNPIEALKNKPTSRSISKFGLRKALIVGQFALSLGFISGVVIVLGQYKQTMSYDFGFQQENILDVPLQGVDPDIFRTEFSRLSAAQDVSMSSAIVGTSSSGTVYVKGSQNDSVQVFQIFVDDHYLKNLNLAMLTGKSFEHTESSKNHAIVNEEFLKKFKLSDPSVALGQSFVLTDKSEIIVIGVVKNFHYAQLREPIQSFFFRYDPKEWQFANIKVSSSDMTETLRQMEVVWKSFESEKKFTSQFFDDEIEEAYSVYFAMIKICGFLGFLAITISCLGLLGMVVFTVENRIKEVGVRKVMGASTTGIILLLSKDFIKLMLIAAVIAMPLSYVFFDQIFLRTQSYKIPIGVTEIVVSILVMVVLGLATILSQTTRAAKANPVDTLRYE
jgi:putative ABC transport system permease protein